MVCDIVAQWWLYWLYCPTTEKVWWQMGFFSAFALICHFTENKKSKTKKRKNPPWMHVWPHLPMSAYLLAHHFLWCVLKMGPKTFVGIVLVLSCTPTSIHLWSRPQRVQNTVHGAKDNSLRKLKNIDGIFVLICWAWTATESPDADL